MKSNIDLIMCVDPNTNKIHDAYKEEFLIASKITNVHLFNIFDLNSINLPKGNGKLLYHGWMMPPPYYNIFYNKCIEFGYELINDPDQYIGCHYFDHWYYYIKDLTPKSLIVEIDDIRKMSLNILSFMEENNCALIIKDYVKSIKQNWWEVCYISRNSNVFEIAKIISNFIEIKQKQNDLQGNLVVKQYVPLKIIGNIPGGMPIAHEFRTFVVNDEPLEPIKYWNQFQHEPDELAKQLIIELANKIRKNIKSNFFTIDVGQLQDGSWTCIEIGDGQVSAIPDHANKELIIEKVLYELS